ncbi:MAG TPA: type II toxin-antitoxin system PemK/MazF family toxin [Methyloceanibacter sp.]|nr:type II toxin-antitoxin system PemK/MazF family toxin [Methyloceanibacter sp.]
MNERKALPAADAAEARPKWREIAIKAAPKLGNVYWCRFNDAKLVPLPEMWKQRPVIVVGHKGLVLRGTCLVVPTSTDRQETNQWKWLLPDYISEEIDGRESWVLYSHLITISTSRLLQIKSKVLRLKQKDINELLVLIRNWLPSPSG